jgi:hypothetical protein
MECEGMMLRSASIGLILAALLVFASCSSESAPIPISAGSESSLSSSGASTIADPLDGTAWRSTYTCDDARKNLETAGLQKFIPKILANCEEVQHGYLAFSGGVLHWGPSDEGVPYQIVNNHTFVETYERYRFRIHGRNAFFEGHIVAALYPYSAEEMRGEEAVDVATNGVQYERVG